MRTLASIVLAVGVLSLGGALAGSNDDVALKQPMNVPNASNAPSDSGVSGSISDEALKNQVLCRQVEPLTGSRLGARRACHTRQQWDDIQQQSQKALEGVQTKSKLGTPGS